MNMLIAFLVWTFLIYWIHRLAHTNKFKLLTEIHRSHHMIDYFNNDPQYDFRGFLFYFGSSKATLDVIVTITLPLILVIFIIGGNSWHLLIFNYLYEAIFSEYILDHNKNLKGNITKVFAWGDFHLTHHKYPKHNYSLLVCLWDYIFRTAK